MASKKTIIIRFLVLKVVILGLVFFFSKVSASSYPYDSMGFNFDSYDGTSCTSSSSILLPAVNYPRTLLQLSWHNQNKNSQSAPDFHVGKVGTAWPNGLYLDTEKDINGLQDVYQLIPPNIAVYCNKLGNITDHLNVSGIYVNRNLASSTYDEIVQVSTSSEIAINNFSSATVEVTNFPTSTTQINLGTTTLQADINQNPVIYGLGILIFVIIVILIIQF